ncbi:MAG: sterol desaturase family protein [Bacteroidota bacterium]
MNFNFEVFSLDYISRLDVPNVILYAAPVMISLVLLEWALTLYKKRDYYDGKDVVAATTIGLVNIAISAAMKVMTFGAMLFVLEMVPWSIPPTWWSYVLCIFALDFSRYWAHRIAHENRFWWATHVTHHNGPKYNWSVSFRLGWTQHIKIIFFLPVALFGFHPVVLFICHQIEVLYQFWIHTEYIRKLPKPIEFFFTTPSHHRVHHATNEQYLDKNYGSTFIIWDRMFGTFQPEEEPANYGITKPFKSYNPVTLCFHEWVDLIRDMKSTKSFRKAFSVMNMRPSEIKYDASGKIIR